jgi:dolichol-phosphate mannosyltransferase
MTAIAEKKKLSIVVPVHNEEENVKPLAERIFKVAEGLANYNTEIIFVDDGSKDTSATVIEELIGAKKPVTLVQL